MVMFFPMVKLAIDGYEVLILSLASPIILGSSLVNNIAEVCGYLVKILRNCFLFLYRVPLEN